MEFGFLNQSNVDIMGGEEVVNLVCGVGDAVRVELEDI